MIHLEIQPPNRSSKRTVLVAVVAVGSKVKLPFTAGAGKRRIDDLALLSTLATKRCTTITPSTSFYNSSSSNPSSPDDTPTQPYPTPDTILNQDVTSPHAFHLMLVLQPINKRLPPNDIVRVKVGDELIVVIPGFNAINPCDDVGCVHCLYFQEFEKVINNTL